MSIHDMESIITVSGKGSWITEVDGTRYFDATSGFWCVNIGYGREDIAKVAAEQIKKLSCTPPSQSHIPGIQLAEKINEWLGGGYRIVFLNSGSEANEAAFTIARQFHKQNGEANRYKIISSHRSYHGHSMRALATNGQAHCKNKDDFLAFGFHHIAPPYCYRCPFGKKYGECNLECAQTCEDAINFEGAESVAAVIIEPIITGGVITPPLEYLSVVRDICDKYGVLLIVDEVTCGFGRSGKPFGHQNFNVIPDIVTMAKGITSGYSLLSATAVRNEVYEKSESRNDHPFQNISKFGGNPVSCAIALENIKVIENENLIERAFELGVDLRGKLEMIVHHPNVGDIRSFGFIIGIEMIEDKESKLPASAKKVEKVINECKKKGLLVGRNGGWVSGFNNIVTLCPPFITTDEELDFIVHVMVESIAELT